MLYQTNIKMIVQNGEEKKGYYFESEELDIQQDSNLQNRKITRQRITVL